MLSDETSRNISAKASHNCRVDHNTRQYMGMGFLNCDACFVEVDVVNESGQIYLIFGRPLEYGIQQHSFPSFRGRRIRGHPANDVAIPMPVGSAAPTGDQSRNGSLNTRSEELFTGRQVFAVSGTLLRTHVPHNHGKQPTSSEASLACRTTTQDHQASADVERGAYLWLLVCCTERVWLL